jgi:hypothetical protein
MWVGEGTLALFVLIGTANLNHVPVSLILASVTSIQMDP